MLRTCDVSHLKHAKCKLSQMKKLMRHVERAARIVNQPHIVLKDCTVDHAFALYNAVKHLFLFDSIKVGKGRRYESIMWKTYYNNLSKRKWKLLGKVGLAGFRVLGEVELAGVGVQWIVKVVAKSLDVKLAKEYWRSEHLSHCSTHPKPGDPRTNKRPGIDTHQASVLN